MAAETASKQGEATAKYVEVLDEGGETSAPAHILLPTQRHNRMAEKVGGKACGTSSRQRDTGTGAMDSRQKARQKKDKEKESRKGERKGKGFLERLARGQAQKEQFVSPGEAEKHMVSTGGPT